MHRFSRSHQATGRFCKRKRWLQYHLDGTGYVPRAVNPAMSTGSVTHDIITSAIKSTPDYAQPNTDLIINLCDNKTKDYRREVNDAGYDNEWSARDLDVNCALAAGLARGWLTYRLPLILKEYRIIAVEQEWNIPISNHLEMMQRHDLVGERIVDKELVTIELKTTGIMTDSYLESWRYSQQILTQLWGLEKVYKRIPLSVNLEFLYKGRKDQYGVHSPFVKAWKHDDGSVAYRNPGAKKGWQAIDSWTYPFEAIPLDILAGQYAQISVMRNPRELDIWLTQTSYEEHSIMSDLTAIDSYETGSMLQYSLARRFPARMDEQCYSDKYSKRCPYLDYCYGLLSDLTTSELFKPRIPHHGQELE